jgi:AraC family transcriptional regulator
VQNGVAVISERILPGGLILRDKRYVAGLRMTKHTHDCWRFCLALSGYFTDSWTPGYRTRSPLQLSLHPSDEAHTSVFHTDTHCFHIEFGGDWEKKLISPEGIHDEPLEFLCGYLPVLAVKMHREFCDADEVSELVLEGLALELIGFSRRQFQADSSPSWLLQIRDALHEGFKGRLSVMTLAEIVGVHPVHLARVFRKHFRQSIGEYVRDLRIQFVCRQLRTGVPITEIAHEAGFADQSHMTRIFKRQTGYTPAQFRDAARRR